MQISSSLVLASLTLLPLALTSPVVDPVGKRQARMDLAILANVQPSKFLSAHPNTSTGVITEKMSGKHRTYGAWNLTQPSNGTYHRNNGGGYGKPGSRAKHIAHVNEEKPAGSGSESAGPIELDDESGRMS